MKFDISVQRYGKFLIYARGKEKLQQICSKNAKKKAASSIKIRNGNARN
jgi:hypothetical protein